MKVCDIDVQEQKVFQRVYDMEVELCVLTRVVADFDPAKCRNREACKELLKLLKAK